MTTVPVEVDDELLQLADAQAAEAGRAARCLPLPCAVGWVVVS